MKPFFHFAIDKQIHTNKKKRVARPTLFFRPAQAPEINQRIYDN